MRGPAVILSIGVALLFTGIVALLTLTQALAICPNPGVCTTRVLWETTGPGFALMGAGVAVLCAGLWLTTSRFADAPDAINRR